MRTQPGPGQGLENALFDCSEKNAGGDVRFVGVIWVNASEPWSRSSGMGRRPRASVGRPASGGWSGARARAPDGRLTGEQADRGRGGAAAAAKAARRASSRSVTRRLWGAGCGPSPVTARLKSRKEALSDSWSQSVMVCSRDDVRLRSGLRGGLTTVGPSVGVEAPSESERRRPCAGLSSRDGGDARRPLGRPMGEMGSKGDDIWTILSCRGTLCGGSFPAGSSRSGRSS
mmetsp:Transcript_5867/g.17330  ORF Transcript_5867/g.17330 Transcript_5867/m.17330 type:complete len:230 (+) Transcript_5867:156-845(+)